MRCPKCHYISFDNGDRCRNCGYDFSLTADTQKLDLPTQRENEPIGPMADLELSNVDAPRSAPAQADVVGRGGAENRPVMDGGSLDLPLFPDRGVRDHTAMVSPPAAPRAPLAVRRSTPPIVKTNPRGADHEEAVLDLGISEPDDMDASPTTPEETPSAAEDAAAPVGRRFLAALVDVSILGAIDAAIVYFTLRLCGLPHTELARLPLVPFGAFVLLLNGGYFVLFTAAGGQTIGKMAARIRVVPSEGVEAAGARVPFGLAVLRAAAYLISVVPAGVGLIPAIVGAEHRALHDRLADTRVVRA